MSDFIRFALGAALIWYVLSASPSPSPSGPYTGPYTSIHQASRSMEENDRINMSEAFLAGGDMVAADKRNLLDNTQEMQDYLIGLLTFDYNGLAKPSNKYPEVAQSLEAELRKTIGTDVKTADAALKQEYINFLKEAGKALR